MQENQELQSTLNEYLREAGYQLSSILKRDEHGLRYLFAIEETTCVIKLYDEYIALEFGVGVVSPAKSMKVLNDACAKLYFCNFPFAVGTPPFDDERLLVLRFRMDGTKLSQSTFLSCLKLAS